MKETVITIKGDMVEARRGKSGHRGYLHPDLTVIQLIEQVLYQLDKQDEA